MPNPDLFGNFLPVFAVSLHGVSNQVLLEIGRQLPEGTFCLYVGLAGQI